MRYTWPLLLLLCCAACSPAAAVESNPTPTPVLVSAAQDLPASPSAPVNEAGEALVARVNGQGITRSAFEAALVRAQQGIMAADPRTLEATVLDTMIDQILIEQAAANAGLSVTEAEIDAEYQVNRSIAESDEAWQAWLAQNGFSEADFREQIRSGLIAGRMRDQVVQAIPEVAMQVHARHILLKSEAEGHDVLARLQAGEDFVALAAAFSQDLSTREQGGDLGWFVEGELLEPALSQVAFALQDGQIGGPVATRLGYHVLQKLESGQRPLEPEKRVLLARIQFENWVRGLTFNAIIERYI